ncbi:SDR family NAD(P)-dependent oxidoreductase [Sporomusa acidovorans]|uniref:Gluconate 5-dehydrogenase n=1 Tax=Sporomusa acidovorans (strain ATCC 49682 / DSM 3132 / Mol) TaxID=1123286 RepID=A0ABZ3J7B0_SPOA4|nr:SDR family oxidoreductase [Sporomusa acidovorans]OZC23484.1 gluconate 5-dehydrogenase [Sporomusa acidovorans DSM 3132]SDF28243.1 NAD(P)-dependent dehydrogenase, short-chain alcohol dehydrogenase family [Sporomusa acidovorans]
MNVLFDFSNKRYVVTGASSGIGRKVAEELAAAGAELLVIARRLPELETLQTEYPRQVTVAAVDVTDFTAVEQHIARFVLNKGQIDGSVHAAGILFFTPLRAFNFAQARQMMDVSYWAGVNLLQLVTKKKFAASKTSHVQFSSVSAYRGQKGLSAYSATKAAMQAGIRAIAQEIADKGHRVNTISPGLIGTTMTEGTLQEDKLADEYLLGTGKTEDVVGMVLFLLSDRANWITGADYVVDGGYLA